MIDTSGIKDNWRPKFLVIEQRITFDRAAMVYKIFNKLCPQNYGTSTTNGPITPGIIHDSAKISRFLSTI